MNGEGISRLTAEGIDALRYAGHRQLTRWGKRTLTPRETQRRDALEGALRALKPFRHGDCELRRVPPRT